MYQYFDRASADKLRRGNPDYHGGNCHALPAMMFYRSVWEISGIFMCSNKLQVIYKCRILNVEPQIAEVIRTHKTSSFNNSDFIIRYFLRIQTDNRFIIFPEVIPDKNEGLNDFTLTISRFLRSNPS